jgi:bifunctional non-homologous end joining protein LigD
VLADDIARRHPTLMMTAYRIATRPKGRVLVDYNQNAWGRTLASVYAVRPTPEATVSTPMTWDEVAGGVEIGDFRLANVRERFAHLGDLWKPLLFVRGRTDLTAFK